MIAYLRDIGLDYRIVAESFETSVPWDRVIGKSKFFLIKKLFSPLKIFVVMLKNVLSLNVKNKVLNIHHFPLVE
jgi:hypothetical protein